MGIPNKIAKGNLRNMTARYYNVLYKYTSIDYIWNKEAALESADRKITLKP